MAADAAGPVYVGYLGVHAADAYVVLHVGPRMGCAIVDGRMAHLHLLGGLELAGWRRESAALDLGCIPSDHDDTPH